MASLSEEVPASPRVDRYITLHLYLPSGEFVAEDKVPIGTSVDLYVHYLESGLVTPKLGVRRCCFDSRPSFVYDLVWNGMILECGRKIEYLIEDHGMSVDEPVNILVILVEIVRERENT